MVFRRLSIFFLLCSQVSKGSAFVLLPPHRAAATASSSTSSSSSSSSRRWMETRDTTTEIVNGEAGLVSMSEAKTQLFNAFNALALPDQYDAVLTGLCAKILDSTKLKQENVAAVLSDPIQLLKEMNQKKIRASPRSLMALIDSAVKSQDANLMASVLQLAVRNGGMARYGQGQSDILQLPTSPTSRVKCADGVIRTRKDRLEMATQVPSDDRASEVTSALAVSAVAAFCIFSDVTNMDDITVYTNLLLSSMIAVGVVDNFYDLIRSGSKLAAAQLTKGDSVELPDKSSLPMGLGSGKLTGTVLRGLTRLLTVDAERESESEAAALFVAYTLGLPVFAFRPNALEASVLVIESTQSKELDSLDTSSGLMKILVWLLAPVAMESMKHSQLIMSDPKEADGFLLRLEDYVTVKGGSLDSIWWLENPQERADLLKWAYTEADLLLRDNKAKVIEMAQILTGGAATIGDCVAVVERW